MAKGLDEEMVGEIVRLYVDENMSSRKVAEQVGCNKFSVIKYVRKAREEVRGTLLTDKDKKRIILLYRNGSSVSEVAKKTNKDRATCGKVLVDNGIEIRNNSIANRIYDIDHDFFNAIDSEEKAYALGLISSDGCVYGGNKIEISLQASDLNVLTKINNAMKSTYPIRTETRSYIKKDGSNAKRARLTITSKKLVDDLRDKGVVERKSLVLKAYSGIKKDLAPAYFRGFFDGDGCITKSGNSWVMGLAGSIDVVEEFSKFVKSHIDTKAKIYKNSEIFEAKFSGIRNAKCIADLLYKDATIYLDRKKKLADEIMKQETKVCDRTSMIKEQVDDLKEIHGTWSKAARHIGTSTKHLQRIRERLGMKINYIGKS